MPLHVLGHTHTHTHTQEHTLFLLFGADEVKQGTPGDQVGSCVKGFQET